MSISISRSLALDYHGDNVGTPADQISKRIANIVDLMDGIEQRNKAPSTLVTEEQIRILRSMIGGSGNTVSVKLSPPLNTECGMLAIGESKTHACLEEVCRHIIDNILVPSRGEIRLQAVIRQQYEVGYHVLGDIKGLDENLMLDCVRMYMAMRCVLHAPFQSVGDVYEPSLEEGSFMELLPRMPKPVKFVDPIIVSIGGYADIIETLTGAGGPLAGSDVLNSTRDPTDLGIQLYKARLLRDYRSCTLVLVMGDDTEGVITTSLSELRKMHWTPSSLICVSPVDSMDVGSPCGATWLSSGESSSDLRSRMSALMEHGVIHSDVRVLSLLKSPYLDVLMLAYPGLDKIASDICSMSDSEEVIHHVSGHILDPVPADSLYPDMVRAVRSVVLNMSNST